MPAPTEMGSAARFAESAEERADRLVTIARSMLPGTGHVEGAGSELPSPCEVQRRIATRLKAADVVGQLPDEAANALARDVAHRGHAAIEQIYRGDVQLHDLDHESIANLEAVIRVVGRPAWYVRQNVPMPDPDIELNRDDDFWIVKIGTAGMKLRRTCGCAGVVTLASGGDPRPFGTAWMIGPRTIVTNAHVAKDLAYRASGISPGDARDNWRMRPGITGAVNFAFENGRNSPARFEIEDVLHVETSGVPDVAMFRLRESAAPAPSPIAVDLANRADWRGLEVFAVGHPIRDLQNDRNVEMVFGALDGTKRFSPGKLVAVVGATVLAHDCSTTNGSSGSPIIDFVSLKAVGLHYFGAPGARNESVLLAAYAEHPAIVKSVTNSWD
jgi:glutamyl endopeptidase